MDNLCEIKELPLGSLVSMCDSSFTQIYHELTHEFFMNYGFHLMICAAQKPLNGNKFGYHGNDSKG